MHEARPTPVDSGSILAECLALAPDVNSEWLAIHGYMSDCWPKPRDVSESMALLSFAADDNSTPSLFNRAYALDQGLQGLQRAKDRGETLPPQAEARWQRLTGILPPEYQDRLTHNTIAWYPHAEYLSKTPRHNPDHQYQQGDYADAFQNYFAGLAQREGIDTNHIQPPYNGDMVINAVPVAAGMFLQTMMHVKPLGIGALSPALRAEGLQLLCDFDEPDFEARAAAFSETAQLARFTHGKEYEHDHAIEFIHDLPETDRHEYTQVFNHLYDSAHGLRDAFPAALGEDIVAGARNLLADAMFAVRDHIEHHGVTSTNITLRNGYQLPVQMDGSKPLELLQSLDAAFRKLHDTVTSPTTRTIPAVAEGEYTIERFVDTTSGAPSTVSLYTRAVESANYNPTYEYGRPSSGVEASISYIVKLVDDEPLSLIKRRHGDDTISIRLDCEQDGRISLDVGSILGSTEVFGTHVARLLAHGNSIRTARVQQTAKLNHVDSINQTYGQPEAFAGIVTEQRSATRAIRATKREWRAYCGRAASRRLANAARVS